MQELTGKDDYSDIIDLAYHGTTTHVPIPPEKRAAQFSPFAALKGLEECYEEEIRMIDEAGTVPQ